LQKSPAAAPALAIRTGVLIALLRPLPSQGFPPARKSIAFTVGSSTIATAFKADPAPIKYYGYIVERTATKFGPIEVKRRP
jgi:hypothetical protein